MSLPSCEEGFDLPGASQDMTPDGASAGSEPSAAFTAGPWIACNMVHAERGDQMTPEEIGEYVANSVRMGDPGRFLFVTTPGHGDPDICHVGNGPAGPANARLIAAAPELYESLGEVIDAALRQLMMMGKGREPSPRLQAAIDKARAALANAEGLSVAPQGGVTAHAPRDER